MPETFVIYYLSAISVEKYKCFSEIWEI
jgi:hypothetical protein